MANYKKLDTDLISEENTHIVIDEESFSNNSYHNYEILKCNNNKLLCEIHFQEGPINEVGCNGIFIEDLINICINRLENFQKSDFSCHENAVAITKLEESLMWLRKRTNNRIKRGVQGYYKK
jgi:hypothetical protein